MKKQIERFKVRIDQNLNRVEKSVALSPDLVKVEETIGVYKQACSSLQKKLSEDLHGYGKGTDGSSVDRRLKKTGDFVLGNIFSEVGRNLHKQNPASCLGNVLIYLGELFPQLANSHVNYEICVEQMIISKLQDVLNTDLPKIKSSRCHLDKLLLELDTTKARLEKAREEEQQHGGVTATQKIDKLNEELDDILRNVDQARDGLAADMLTFLSRDNEIAGLLSNYIDYRIQLAKENQERLEDSKPRIDSLRSLRKGFPIFGSSLQDHIRDLKLESGIAFPIQLCCIKLLEMGLDEEGLFRLTAGASKVKRLRAEIEAGHAFTNSVEGYDHHVFTGLIKTYLRELPSPLLGEELYSDWLEAGSLGGEDRFNAIWNLLQSDYLPRENYKNIQYLFRFLHEVTQHSDKNKMSANNLAIIITPNVIWSNTAVQDAMDVGAGGVLQQVIELIISQHTWFFQNDPPVLWNQNFAPLKTCLPFTCQNNEASSSLPADLPAHLPAPPSTLTREKSKKLKGKPAAPPSSLSTSYSPNGTVLPSSPPSSPQIQYRQHSSSPATPRTSESFRALTHPAHPPPKPPSSVRASIELGSHSIHQLGGGGASGRSQATTPTRPRAMTESSKVGLNKMSEMKTSPEKLMTQGTKDLLNIGTILVIGGDKQHQHEVELSSSEQNHAENRTSNHQADNKTSIELQQTNRHERTSSSEGRGRNTSSTTSSSSSSTSSSAESSRKESYPVPAPRNLKPAIPTKPEGLVMGGGGGGGNKSETAPTKLNGIYPNIKDVDLGSSSPPGGGLIHGTPPSPGRPLGASPPIGSNHSSPSGGDIKDFTKL